MKTLQERTNRLRGTQILTTTDEVEIQAQILDYAVELVNLFLTSHQQGRDFMLAEQAALHALNNKARAGYGLAPMEIIK